VAEVDRTQLADGRYGATITIVADDPRVPAHTIAVTAEVTSPDLAADAGQHYVVLVDVDGNRSESLQVVNAVNGEYAFRLEDVPPGEYRLFAGTDLDDDDVICDGTEACGAYPSLTNPAIILVNPSEEPEIDERSFPSEFRTTATATGLGAQSGIPAEDTGLRLQRTTGRAADDD
jgi:serine protease